MNDELRAAAERCVDYDCSLDDAELVGRAWLASNPAPRPVTRKGLEALGFENDPGDASSWTIQAGPTLVEVLVLLDENAVLVGYADIGTARDLGSVARLVAALKELQP